MLTNVYPIFETQLNTEQLPVPEEKFQKIISTLPFKIQVLVKQKLNIL